MSERRSFKERWFDKGLRRSFRRWTAPVVNRATRASLRRSFAELAIPPGAVICVHSALSNLGHLVEGPESVVLALQEAVPDCTIMMPTFPFAGSTLDYLRSKPTYDPARTPSRIGLLTETFRKMPGVLRSLHPTHPCAARGPAAEELIAGSEDSVEPFGDFSMFGRFSMREDAYVVLIHTRAASIVHRVHEIVGWPRLFLAGTFEVAGIDSVGRRRIYRVKVHDPARPRYVILSENEAGQVEHVRTGWYGFQFPSSIEERIAELLSDGAGWRALSERQQEFLRSGILRQTTHGRAEILAIHVQPWQQRICRDLHDRLITFASWYQEPLDVPPIAGVLSR